MESHKFAKLHDNVSVTVACAFLAILYISQLLSWNFWCYQNSSCSLSSVRFNLLVL